ncbi:hypothetical protein [Vibrio harveyi]|uniref:hypothetical protein n=1 Tax=Vibrio harveyi TaxID=669 RepID=UPI0012DB20F5|nr:hypothetical protein [Vibrio harveyi]EHD1698269.1 hypothetical protein [Vibrio vulnificus]HDM8057052.1 hypothetical protein [Vibrio harveyi]HDM8062747.1 hypothetical protein [Vibrio harveyi]
MKLPVRERVPPQTDCNNTGEGRNENREIKESRKQCVGVIALAPRTGIYSEKYPINTLLLGV